MFDDRMTTNVNQKESFYNHVWVLWFDTSKETVNEVSVVRGESVSEVFKKSVLVTTQPRQIRSKFDCL